MITKLITYGMSVQSIAESLFGDKEDMTEDQKLKEAQKIQDSLMKGFPAIARSIANAQKMASKVGYTETILGRRRHHPNMQLPKFEFEPGKGYVNPDIDPLDPESLKNKEKIPKRIIDALTKEFNSYKWYGKIVKRTKELAEQGIKVVNNSYKIEEASRQVFNCVDKETEILTLNGWKKYNEISIGDKILSYSIETDRIEEDEIIDIHIYNEPAEVVGFKNNNIDVISTFDHKWVVYNRTSHNTSFHTTREIASGQVREGCALLVAFEKDTLSDSDLFLEDIQSLSIYNTIAQDGVWCVTTNNHTWIAKRNNRVAISSNSIIQGRLTALPLSI